MRWILVSTPDDVCLVKADHFCHPCFERKTRKTILLDLPLEGDDRRTWVAMVQTGTVKAYGVKCNCFTE